MEPAVPNWGFKDLTIPHVWGPLSSDRRLIKSCGRVCFPKMGLTLTLLFLTALTTIWSSSTTSASAASSGVKITPQGGYTDLVIKIQDDVPEDHCPAILENLKVHKKIISEQFLFFAKILKLSINMASSTR